jgi:hypothetical protein
MTLLPNEREIPLGLPGLTLTTHRVRLRAGSQDQLAVTSMMLENVTRVTGAKTETAFLLILAAIVGCVGIGALFVSPGPEGKVAFALAALIGILLVYAYFRSRRTALIITSADGGSIYVRMGHMTAGNMVFLIDKIEESMDQRAYLLAGYGAVG